MSTFRIIGSHRMESLAEALAEAIVTPLSHPLAQEVIVVQSAGMERWLSLYLANRSGVCANCKFPFPDSFMSDVFQSVLGHRAGDSFRPETMAWRLMTILSRRLKEPLFAPLRRFCAKEPADLRLFQLAERIAAAFDGYSVFRPSMLLQWERGVAPQEWQAELWRDLVAEIGPYHRATLREELRTSLNGNVERGLLPERVHVFGVSYLPVFYLDLFHIISRKVPVTLFLLNPCREFWGDVVSEKQKAKRLIQTGLFASADAYYETGNPLLSSMGKVGKDFFDIIWQFNPDSPETGEPDLLPIEESLLRHLQQDIVSLVDRTKSSSKSALRASDRSIAVHSAHSPQREMEILHDRLLEMFDERPELKPTDILVMTPDIETYAPFITAVFEGVQDPLLRIPYSIADRSARGENRLARFFLSLLALPGSRFSVTEVFDLLENPLVLRRFKIGLADLDRIRRWVSSTRVRWGRDGRHRGEFGIPEFDENSWQTALDRLLLGYALPGNDTRLFNGMLPAEGVEGKGAVALGALVEFTTALFAICASLDTPRTPASWQNILTDAVDRLTEVTLDDDGERRQLLAAFDELASFQGKAAYDQPVGLAVVRAWLSERLQRETSSVGFLSRGVTFCSMLPMRSIPFKVIALVGMNDDAFPRRSRAAGFDLVARFPQKGDRSRRDEDRYLFLEALLSARETFYLSYVGQNIRDNSRRPPSVLVSELLDYIDRSFSCKGETPSQVLTVEHPLQAFSRRYFEGDALRSYSRENCDAVREAVASLREPGVFLNEPLPEVSEEVTSLSLDELARFFRNPSRYFLRSRLGIFPEGEDTAPEETEPFSLDHLDRYMVLQELTERLLRGEDPADFELVVKQRGILPPGKPGDILMAGALRRATQFAAEVAALGVTESSHAEDIDLRVGTIRLTGRIEGITDRGLVRFRCASLKASDILMGWLNALCLAAMEKEMPTTVVGSDGLVIFPSIEAPMPELEQLAGLYLEGLREPLPLFPESSREYARIIGAGGEETKAMDAARKKWRGSNGRRGEGDDPAYLLCFKGREPLGDRFRLLAESIFAPILSSSAGE